MLLFCRLGHRMEGAALLEVRKHGFSNGLPGSRVTRVVDASDLAILPDPRGQRPQCTLRHRG